MKIIEIKAKAELYANSFEIKERADGTKFTCFKEDAPKELVDAFLESLRIEDFDYSTFRRSFEIIADYGDDYELYDVMDEMIDGMVDMMTYDLLKWLAESIYNVDYMTQAIKDYDAQDGFQVLSIAQGIAIREIFEVAMSLLSK